MFSEDFIQIFKGNKDKSSSTYIEVHQRDGQTGYQTQAQFTSVTPSLVPSIHKQNKNNKLRIILHHSVLHQEQITEGRDKSGETHFITLKIDPRYKSCNNI
uniref:Uncharacterized protein n=1 Tax=Arundo donax TaxID=35708 RepID=A0A0A8Z4S2_ARUDO